MLSLKSMGLRERVEKAEIEKEYFTTAKTVGR
jgi:hypothetical protein